jgi:uncharacterized membrane protein
LSPSSPHYFPLALPFLLALFALLAAVVLLVELRILGYVYERMGVDQRSILALLVLSLLGSYVNIPVARLPAERIVSDVVVSVWGVPHVVPAVRDWPGTIVAVNLGGAVIPTLLAIFLMVRNRVYLRSLVAVAVVAAAVHAVARPVPGVGITTPTLVPPLVAAGVALLSREHTPPIAFIAGTLGTLIGADLMNLGRVAGLGAPVASIGGAGTFDGIFLSGILAVLLVPLRAPRHKPPAPREQAR